MQRNQDAAAAPGDAAPASRLGAAADACARVGGWLSALMILAVLAITIVAVVRRYLLSDPLLGADAAVGFLVVFIVMLGAAEALRRGDHIRIDILYDRCGPRLRWWLDLLAQLSVLGFAVLLGLTGWRTMMFSRRFEAYSPGELALPMWMLQTALVLGALLLGLAALTAFLRLLARRPR